VPKKGFKLDLEAVKAYEELDKAVPKKFISPRPKNVTQRAARLSQKKPDQLTHKSRDYNKYSE
jgi:hypothetical protein